MTHQYYWGPAEVVAGAEPHHGPRAPQPSVGATISRAAGRAPRGGRRRTARRSPTPSSRQGSGGPRRSSSVGRQSAGAAADAGGLAAARSNSSSTGAPVRADPVEPVRVGRLARPNGRGDLARHAPRMPSIWPSQYGSISATWARAPAGPSGLGLRAVVVAERPRLAGDAPASEQGLEIRPRAAGRSISSSIAAVSHARRSMGGHNDAPPPVARRPAARGQPLRTERPQR